MTISLQTAKVICRINQDGAQILEMKSCANEELARSACQYISLLIIVCVYLRTASIAERDLCIDQRSSCVKLEISHVNVVWRVGPCIKADSISHRRINLLQDHFERLNGLNNMTTTTYFYIVNWVNIFHGFFNYFSCLEVKIMVNKLEIKMGDSVVNASQNRWFDFSQRTYNDEFFSTVAGTYFELRIICS